MLQVTCLYNDEMSGFKNIHTDLCGNVISSMNTKPRLVSGHAKGMSIYLIRIIAFWNQHQYMSVKWGNAGILSSLLFNVYNDDLNLTLSKSNIGCRLGGRHINHIVYVEELCILIMSSCGM